MSNFGNGCERGEVPISKLSRGDRFTMKLSLGRDIKGEVIHISPNGVTVKRDGGERKRIEYYDDEGNAAVRESVTPSKVEHWALSTCVVKEE